MATDRVLLLPILALLIAGCPGNEPPDDVGDDDVSGDDDTGEPTDVDGDGYAGDEDCDDSDPSVYPGAHEDPCNGHDDDCDGVVDESDWPMSVSYSTVEIATLWASGGDAGGEADVYVYQTMFDEWDDMLCGVSYKVVAGYSYGPGQGDDLFAWGDEVLEFEDIEAEYMTCPEEWIPDLSTLVEAWRWMLHPLVFVSCEQVNADPALGSTYVGREEDWGMVGDGSFDHLCNGICPGIGGYHDTGPCEGIWMVPGAEDDLENWGDFAYFPPASTANVEIWRFQGFVHAGVWNDDEDPDGNGPTTGLQGEYRLTSSWPFETEVTVCP